jgi:uncharacterized protein (DUF58 family)
MVVVLEVSMSDLDVSLGTSRPRIGAEVQVTVAVRNAGGAPRRRQLRSSPPAPGFHRALAERRPLKAAPGATRALFHTPLDGAPGVYRIAAAADP